MSTRCPSRQSQAGPPHQKAMCPLLLMALAAHPSPPGELDGLALLPEHRPDEARKPVGVHAQTHDLPEVVDAGGATDRVTGQGTEIDQLSVLPQDGVLRSRCR